MKLAAAVLPVLLASGCENASAVRATPPAQPPPLTLRLDAPTEARANAAIPLKLTLRNSGTEPAQVMLGGRPPYDFVIRAADGARVWRWSEGQAVQMILETRTLRPGEQIVYELQWTIKDREGAFLPPGRYRLRGMLNMDPPETMETAPQELAVIAR